MLFEQMEYTPMIPWFRFSSFAERSMFIFNFGAICVLVNELLISFYITQINSPTRLLGREHIAALKWFHDSPGFSKRVHGGVVELGNKQ